MGWPSAAASASMPPTPQPSTPMPLAVGVWLSVPTTVSKCAVGIPSASPVAPSEAVTTRAIFSMFSWWQMPVAGGVMSTLSNDPCAQRRKR